MKVRQHVQRLLFQDIQVRAVSVPFRRPIVSKVGQFTHWPIILIDVKTKEGIVGRSYLEPYLHTSVKPLVLMLEDLGRVMKGKALAPLDAHRDAMHSLHLNGREGMALIAIAGLDMAIWDALAKSAGMPLAVLLGGTPGNVRAYNTTGLWLIPFDKLAREAEELVAEGGFKAIKIRLGRPSLKEDIDAIAEVRKAVGEGVELMADFNQGLAFGEALHRLRGLDDQGLVWFEEPLIYDNYDGSAQLAREIRTPIQIGENIYGAREFYKAVKAAAADLYMPDPMRIGGITGWMRAAAIAGAAGLPLSSHLYAPVSAHLLRVSESADWLEWSDWIEPILEEPFRASNSLVAVTSKPGIGLEWNEKAVKRFEL